MARNSWTLKLLDAENILSSFAEPRTGDENIHQPSGALLPIGTRRHVGYSDQCPKQIEWLDIFANIAAFDCALHQRLDRSLDLSAGIFIELRSASDESIQCRGDDVLGRDVINEQQHPGSQCVDRSHGLSEVPLCGGKLLYLSAIDRLDQCLAGRKVSIQSSCSHLRLFGDVV